MTLRIVTSSVTIADGERDAPVFLRAGTWLDVVLGSDMESRIGAASLRAVTAAELGAAQGGGAGAVSN